MTPDEMANAIADLTEKVRAMSEELDFYRINGMADFFSGRGNQLFGGNAMRLDRNGIQIRENNVAEIFDANKAIYWLAELSRSPMNEDYYSAMRSDNQPVFSGRSQDVTITSQALPDNYAYVSVMAHSDDIESINWDMVQIGSIDNIDGRYAILNISNYDDDPTITYETNVRSEVLAYVSQVRGDGSTLTIASDAITITTGYHLVDTESGAATDNLATINGGETGQILVLRSVNSGRDVTVKDSTGNIRLAGDFTLSTTDYTLTLIYDGGNWYELSRTGAGA